MAAQNAGSLFMLITGLYADRINGKWMVGASLLLCTLGNFLLPSFAQVSFWYAIGGKQLKYIHQATNPVQLLL